MATENGQTGTDERIGPEEDTPNRVLIMLLLSVKDFYHDQGPKWAAAIAYYSLLSFFPLLLAAGSLAAFFVDPQWAIDQITQLLGEFLPEGSAHVQDVVKGAVEARNTTGVLSLAGLLFTGSRVFGAVAQALNIACDVDETYGPLKRIAVEIFMLLTLGVIFVLAFFLAPLLGLVWQWLGHDAGGRVFRLANEGLPVLFLLLAFFFSYWLVPRRTLDWRSALVGAGIGTLLFILARPLFLYYIRRFGEYNLIYGSLAVAVILVLWAWIVANILILGGEIAAHTQDMLIEGKRGEVVERGHLIRSPLRRIMPDSEKIGGE